MTAVVETDRVVGSMLGLALGDAFGAPHEGGVIERALWALIGKTRGKAGGKRRFTDDTQMSVDLAESLIACGRVDQDDLARRFAGSYRWSRGYGPGAAKILRRIRRGEPWKSARCSVFAEGSYGNGGAMRSPVVGLFHAHADDDVLEAAADATAAVTHAHPLGREGAVLIATATKLAYHGLGSREMMERLVSIATSREFCDRLKTAGAWLDSAGERPPNEVVRTLGNGVAAIDSCVTAIYIALRFRERDFLELLRVPVQLGGDVDTISAMAGAIWGAARGVSVLPRGLLDRLEQSERLVSIAQSLASAIGGFGPGTCATARGS